MSSTKVIRVAGTTNAKNLAGSIISAVCDGVNEDVSIQAMGHGAVGQAVKAVCIANGTLATKGYILVIIPSLINKDIENVGGTVETKTVTVLRLRKQELR